MTTGCGCDKTCSNKPRAALTFNRASSFDKPRAFKSLIIFSSSLWANSFNTDSSRSRISWAALRVKVIAKISLGATPSSNKRKILEINSHVLPLPAQASITHDKRGSQALSIKSLALNPHPFSTNSAYITIATNLLRTTCRHRCTLPYCA